MFRLSLALLIAFLHLSESFTGVDKNRLLGSPMKRPMDMNAEAVENQKDMTWQEKVIKVFDVSVGNEERSSLIQDLVNEREQARDAVLEAIKSGSLEGLYPPIGKEGQAKNAVDFLRASEAVKRQIQEDIIPKVKEDPSRARSDISKLCEHLNARKNRTAEPIGNSNRALKTKVNCSTNADSHQNCTSSYAQWRSLFSDPEKLRERAECVRERLAEKKTKLREKAQRRKIMFKTLKKNMLSYSREGTDAPSFTVLKSSAVYEIRQYETYPVCSIELEQTEEEDTFISQTVRFRKALGSLAEYVYSDASEPCNFTAPTIVDKFSDGSKLVSFILPGKYSNKLPPVPTNSNVTVGLKDNELVAVTEFPGFPTPEEVSRRLVALEEALSQDGVSYVPGEYRLVQYNPLYTAPTFRRNEIVVKLSRSKPDYLSSLTTTLS